MKRSFLALVISLVLSACGGTDDTDPKTDAGKTEPSKTMTISCADACQKVMDLCKGQPGYSSTWEDVCRSSCETLEKIQLDKAKVKTDCADQASTCTDATACMSTSP